MTEAAAPERTKLLKGKRWPKDRYGDELDVEDFVVFTDYRGYPRPAFGKVCRVGKTGKVHVRTIKLHPKDTIAEIEVKECTSITKLSQNVANALMMDKLARA